MKNTFIIFFLSGLGFYVTGQQRVGILTSSPLGTLDIHRGTATEGTLVARGTNYPSQFNYGTNEHTYIRGGKSASHVILNDQPLSGNVGIGILTNPLQKLHVVGSTYITDKLGLGVSSPNGTLQFANTVINRKIVLWDSFNNDNQFYGLGINGNMLRYQVSGTGDSHAFWAGTSSLNSIELMRIKGDGTVAIGTTVPDNSALLQLNSTTRGLLIPRMTTQQRNVIVSPEPGLMILNLDDQCIDIYDGVNWIKNCGLKITGTDTLPAAWTTMADFAGTPREGAIAFTIGTKGYMGTGYDGSYRNDFWEYDPVTNIWTQKADASPTARTEAVGISITSSIGERGYMGTGLGESGYLNDWWEYNATTNSWTQKMDFLGESRSEAVGVPIGNFGFVGTGKGDSGFLSDIWKYSPENNDWYYTSTFPYGTYGAVGYAVDEDFLHIGSGWKQGSPNYTTNSIYRYSFYNGSWYPEDAFNGEDRHSAITFVINGEVYFGLGKTDNNVFKNDIWKYGFTGEEFEWIQQSNFPGTARANAVMFIVNDKIWIGTGNDGGYKNDFRVYEPFPQANVYATPTLPQPLYSMSDGMWTRANTVVHPSNLNSSMVGIGLTNAVNRLDIHTGSPRTGSHPTGKSLYVTGPLSPGADGIEFRHSNGTQGIGFGHNTIYATGSDEVQHLGLAARGATGDLIFLTNGAERMRILGTGSVGIGTYSSDANLAISRGVGGEGSLVIYGTTHASHFHYSATEDTYIRGGKAGAHVILNDLANLGNVGIGTLDPAQKLHVVGNAFITSKIGIGVSTPNAPLQFAYGSQNRKIVLQEAANNDHQFFGFGIGGGELRYQVNSPADHVFYKGTTPTQSVEQMRIRDNGNVDVSGTVEMGWERKTITAQILGNLTTALTCNCTSPKKVIGGGASADLDGAVLIESYPSTDSQWQVVYKNEQPYPISITVYAICARIGD